MSIRIRTQRANGQQNEELYASEYEGLRALQRNLNAHRQAGNTVTEDPTGTIYTVTDADGAFVQKSEVVRSV